MSNSISRRQQASRLVYASVHVGQAFSFSRTFTQADLKSFSELVGDYNPLHNSHSYTANTSFGKPIAHGMLTASLFSALVGMFCPGEKCLYLGQTVKFLKPVFPGDQLEVVGTIISKVDSVRLLKMKTEVFYKTDLVLKGQADVKFMDEELR